MIQKFKIGWFHRETGLLFNVRMSRKAWHPLFFIMKLIVCLMMVSVVCLYEDTCPVVLAGENASISPVDEPAPVVVVIDPGHGGNNLGGEYEDYTEKDLTLAVAKAMKEELECYEGITVYLTRTNDTALSLEERCDFAESVGADFLFCLHFNMSEYHTLFGAETWVSAFGEQYSRGYAFASIEMELLQDMGLYSRGIKTRLGDNGQDYYGIIRHATEKNMPCVLIEHCHLDQENDKPFLNHNEKLKDFGRLDAEAVAKYYGLRSESLGKDFSSYQNITVAVPTQTVAPDRTEPDICMIELVKQNMNNGDVTVSVSAADYDSGMLYYTYSYDGGKTFSELQRWPDKTKDTFAFTLTVPSGIIPQIVVNAYNGYDLYTTSNLLSLPSVNYEDKNAAKETQAIEMQETEDADASIETSAQVLSKENRIEKTKDSSEKTTEERQPATISYFIKVCLICIVLVLAMLFSMLIILRSYAQSKKRRRRHR